MRHPVGLRRAHGDQHVVCRSIRIERGNAFAQQGGAVDFRIVQRKLQQRPGILAGQKVAHAGAFDRAIGQVIFDRALKLRLEIFEIEIVEWHKFFPRSSLFWRSSFFWRSSMRVYFPRMSSNINLHRSGFGAVVHDFVNDNVAPSLQNPARVGIVRQVEEGVGMKALFGMR